MAVPVRDTGQLMTNTCGLKTVEREGGQRCSIFQEIITWFWLWVLLFFGRPWPLSQQNEMSKELKVYTSTCEITDYLILWKFSPCFSLCCVRACVKSLLTQLLPALAWLKCQWKRVRLSAPTSHIFEVKICKCVSVSPLTCKRHKDLLKALTSEHRRAANTE